MRRREFITLLGGTLADQAIPANAQAPVRVRTVEVLMGFANDADAKARTEAFQQGLETEGWPTERASLKRFAGSASILAASCRAPSQPICRWSSQVSSNS